MSVTQLSDFENKNICYEEPIRKNREIRVGIVDSNEDTLYVQLPEMRLEKINYVDDSSEKGLIDTIVLKITEADAKSSKSIYKKLRGIETTNIQSMAKRSEEWFGKSLKKESIQNMFEHCLYENNESKYCFKIHVSQTKQLPDAKGIINDVEVYNQKGKARGVSNLKIGETIHIGYLDQNTFELKEEHCQNKRVIDFVKEKSSIVSTNNGILTAAKLLEKFLFTPSQQFSPIKKLSGGEKRRLAICIILIESPNVLLLDEPTNDLDLETLRILEDFLEIFKGSIVIVSHDRYFLDRTIDHLLYFDENEVKLFEGNYTQFIDKQRSITYSRKNNNSTKLVNNHNNKKRAQKKQLHKKGLSFKEKTELNGITINLQELEKKKESIEKDISTWSGDLSQLSNDLACTIEELATLEERWLELSEIDASN